MTDLKDCPFCGSSDVELQGCDEGWSVCCESCEAGYWTSEAKDAESIWNNRVSPWRALKDDPPDEEVCRDAGVIVRRQWNTHGTVTKRLYEYRVLEHDFHQSRVVSRGWLEWMEVPE